MKNQSQPLGTATSTGNMYQESDIKNQQANITQKRKKKKKLQKVQTINYTTKQEKPQLFLLRQIAHQNLSKSKKQIEKVIKITKRLRKKENKIK